MLSARNLVKKFIKHSGRINHYFHIIASKRRKGQTKTDSGLYGTSDFDIIQINYFSVEEIIMQDKKKIRNRLFFSRANADLEKLCDKVAIIKSGKLIRSGTMEEVKGDESLEEVFLELGGSEA